MAKAKKQPAKKPVKKKPAGKKTPAANKKPAAKKKPAKKKPAAKKPDVNAEAEREAATFLKDYADGNIDNAWDVIGDLFELDKKLPKSSKLRPEFDRMYEDIEKICRESAGGGDDGEPSGEPHGAPDGEGEAGEN